MTNVQIFDRISSVVAGEPFRFERAVEPFSIERQPNQRVDQVYCLVTEHAETEGLLSDDVQIEIEHLRISLARKLRQDPHGVYRQMLVDVNSLVPAVLANADGQDYNIDLLAWSVPTPDEGHDHVIGWVEFAVDYDRQL